MNNLFTLKKEVWQWQLAEAITRQTQPIQSSSLQFVVNSQLFITKTSVWSFRFNHYFGIFLWVEKSSGHTLWIYPKSVHLLLQSCCSKVHSRNWGPTFISWQAIRNWWRIETICTTIDKFLHCNFSYNLDWSNGNIWEIFTCRLLLWVKGSLVCNRKMFTSLAQVRRPNVPIHYLEIVFDIRKAVQIHTSLR